MSLQERVIANLLDQVDELTPRAAPRPPTPSPGLQGGVTLTYFDGRGLAETPRYLLALAGVEHEDKRYPLAMVDGAYAKPEMEADAAAWSELEAATHSIIDAGT